MREKEHKPFIGIDIKSVSTGVEVVRSAGEQRELRDVKEGSVGYIGKSEFFINALLRNMFQDSPSLLNESELGLEGMQEEDVSEVGNLKVLTDRFINNKFQDGLNMVGMNREMYILDKKMDEFRIGPRRKVQQLLKEGMVKDGEVVASDEERMRMLDLKVVYGEAVEDVLGISLAGFNRLAVERMGMHLRNQMHSSSDGNEELSGLEDEERKLDSREQLELEQLRGELVLLKRSNQSAILGPVEEIGRAWLEKSEGIKKINAESGSSESAGGVEEGFNKGEVDVFVAIPSEDGKNKAAVKDEKKERRAEAKERKKKERDDGVDSVKKRKRDAYKEIKKKKRVADRREKSDRRAAIREEKKIIQAEAEQKERQEEENQRIKVKRKMERKKQIEAEKRAKDRKKKIEDWEKSEEKAVFESEKGELGFGEMEKWVSIRGKLKVNSNVPLDVQLVWAEAKELMDSMELEDNGKSRKVESIFSASKGVSEGAEDIDTPKTPYEDDFELFEVIEQSPELNNGYAGASWTSVVGTFKRFVFGKGSEDVQFEDGWDSGLEDYSGLVFRY